MFDDRQAERDLRRYRRKGPARTTRMLLDALTAQGVDGATLLDIGGGIGAIPNGLLASGVTQATAVDASSAYLRAAQEEAARQGHRDRIDFRHGDFVELAPNVPESDLVTLDRVICCYPDVRALVSASAARARRLYGVVVPRDTWWNRLGMSWVNLGLRLSGSAFRAFVHPAQEIEGALAKLGFERVFDRETFVWQVAVYARRAGSSPSRQNQ